MVERLPQTKGKNKSMFFEFFLHSTQSNFQSRVSLHFKFFKKCYLSLLGQTVPPIFLDFTRALCKQGGELCHLYLLSILFLVIVSNCVEILFT